MSLNPNTINQFPAEQVASPPSAITWANMSSSPAMITVVQVSSSYTATTFSVNLSPSLTVQPRPSSSRDEINQTTSERRASDPNYVSSAFLELKIPEPKQKKVVETLRNRLPKALSGTEAIKMLQDRRDKKQAENEAKARRKEERLQKRKQKEAELELKKAARERKQALKKPNTSNKKGKTTSRKRKPSYSSSGSEAEKYRIWTKIVTISRKNLICVLAATKWTNIHLAWLNAENVLQDGISFMLTGLILTC